MLTFCNIFVQHYSGSEKKKRISPPFKTKFTVDFSTEVKEEKEDTFVCLC